MANVHAARDDGAHHGAAAAAGPGDFASIASWAIAEDVFWARYGVALSQFSASWRPLPHLRALSGQLEAGPTTVTPPLAPPGDELLGAATPAIEPWLLLPLGLSEAAGLGRSGAASASRRRAALFQYKPYLQQDHLHLSDQDVSTVLQAAFGKLSLGASGGAAPTAAPPAGLGVGSPTADVACVILIKLIIDMYLGQGPEASFGAVHLLLKRALIGGAAVARARVFDLILNLAVHGEMLYDAPGDSVPEDSPAVEAALTRLDKAGPSADWRATVTSALRASLGAGLETPRSGAGGGGMRNDEFAKGWPPLPPGSANDGSGAGSGDLRSCRFRQWLLLLLFSMLDLLHTVQGPSDPAWTAAAAALVALGARGGAAERAALDALPLGAAAALLRASRVQAWPEGLRAWLGALAANLLYVPSADAAPTGALAGRALDAKRLAAFGGPRAVAVEYLEAQTMVCQRSFFCVLFDYLATGSDGGAGSGGVAASRAAHLLSGMHRRQVDALGAALLLSRAAEGLAPVLRRRGAVLGGAAATLAAQLAAAQETNPQGVVQPPPGCIEQTLEALQEIVSGAAGCSAGAGLPATTALAEALQAVSLADTDTEAPSAAEALLAAALVAAADDAAAGGGAPAALLPAPPAGNRSLGPDIGAAWQRAGVRPSEGPLADAVAAALQRGLPDPQGAAGIAFARAVVSVLDHVKLAAAGLDDGGSSRGGWVGANAADATAAALATLGLAAEWLGLAPPGPRQRALGIVTEATVAALLTRGADPTPQTLAGLESAAGSLASLKTVPSAGDLASEAPVAPFDPVSATEAAAPALAVPPSPPAQQESARLAGQGPRPQSPLAKLVPMPKLGAVWRRLTGPHGGGGGSGRAVAPVEPAVAETDHSSGLGAPTMAEPPVQPLSAGLSALGPAGAAAVAERPGSHAAQPQQQPHHQDTHQQQQWGTAWAGPSLLGLAAERAAAERRAASTVHRRGAEALAGAEARVTASESFLAGLSQPTALPERAAAAAPLLRALFDALRPETMPGWAGGRGAAGSPPLSSARQSPCGATTGIGFGSTSSRSGGSFARQAAFQVGRPLWDARAAAVALLLRCAVAATEADAATPVDASFIASLLADCDPRVRRAAATFVLSRFAAREGRRYRGAMREAVARAQRSGDDRLLFSPEAQVATMLKARALSLDAVV